MLSIKKAVLRANCEKRKATWFSLRVKNRLFRRIELAWSEPITWVRCQLEWERERFQANPIFSGEKWHKHDANWLKQIKRTHFLCLTRKGQYRIGLTDSWNQGPSISYHLWLPSLWLQGPLPALSQKRMGSHAKQHEEKSFTWSGHPQSKHCGQGVTVLTAQKRFSSPGTRRNCDCKLHYNQKFWGMGFLQLTVALNRQNNNDHDTAGMSTTTQRNETS